MFDFSMQTMILSGITDMFERLNITWQGIVLHLIALIILPVGLYLLLFKPVKKMIRERQEKVKKIEKENADLNEEVKKLKNSTEETLAEAKKEAAAIHDNAVKVAGRKADDIMADAKRRAKALVDRTEAEMAEERRKLEAEIERQIADVSVSVAEKVLGRTVSREDNKKLIDESLKEWSEDEKTR